MIFASNAAGQCIYVGREWKGLTGQEAADALGRGWLARVHPDDRRIVEETIAAANAQAAEYSIRYRLLRPDGGARWVAKGGVPSFELPANRFIGYLGKIAEVAQGATDTIMAYGNVGRFVPHAPHPATTPSDRLDQVADQLLLAHSMVEGADVAEALPDIRRALFKVGCALAQRDDARARLLN